ncbi:MULTISPECIES: GTP-sensing pleiotropic transcriptional regulator CodY [unclassified Fusibacter]|uniref:GTP-sensing pleiotropic transcriptional regulator CodY n=1 Tax=unclassified Fusibacter TaxID=2624464 RepID=UPI001010BFB0|nr:MULTISPECIES: GTP-sensing pleiotropic transcriptional regulator CodY [unclassified Fusibacter]MCK8058750.1 GTP-sensing pleiotropic transcriptional regulator CodY [Fusibacter sp. A2]NPE21824.1 GTP-sensing pleiotropic transcriptional regulator CodY [Fusibacter sp. A1]RXV61396.1 GTP-sensing pleiotropic transcriptional regulator CodY [Fusibacter sp. A1]
MASTLLEKTRLLNRVLQNVGDKAVSFNELAILLRQTLNSNVYVAGKKGKMLGYSLDIEEDSSIIIDETSGTQKFPDHYNESLLTLHNTIANLTGEKLLEILTNETNSAHKFITIVPIYGNGERLGTLLLARHDDLFTDEDLVLAEIAATVVSMEIIRSKSEELQEELRKSAVVQMAIGTLSYSELEAIEHIFAELDGDEGLLVASKIADRVGITRSVIVNALRKFESAGVIESRSLGMKGTHIRILNDKLMPELSKPRR